MRTARPKRLYSGRWGAWVTGGDVEPGMLICVRTRNGISWYSKVNNVLWQGPWGAICERIDIAEWDELNLEIPFLDLFELDNGSDQLLLGQLQNIVYDGVKKAIGHAPEIEQYEYYKDYRAVCDTYKSKAQDIIEIIDRERKRLLQVKFNKRAEVTLHSQKECVSDENIRTDFWEEDVRRQRERIPRQIAGLSDYNRLYGRDSAH